MGDLTEGEYIELCKRQHQEKFPNGALCMFRDNIPVFIKYNTGDRVWFNDNGDVISILTHDDLIFNIK